MRILNKAQMHNVFTACVERRLIIKCLNFLISIVKSPTLDSEIRTLSIDNLFCSKLIKFPKKNKCDFKH